MRRLRILQQLCGVGALVVLGISAQGGAAITCHDEELMPGDHHTEDLLVTGKCTVSQDGVYAYRNVNVFNPPFAILNPSCDRGPSLVFEDGKIDFWARSMLVENAACLQAGSSTQPVGSTEGNRLTIHLYGSDQDEPITCQTEAGPRSGPCGIPGKIWMNNGRSKVELPGGVEDYFYDYNPLPLEPAGTFFGRKVLAVSYGGTLRLFGKHGVKPGIDEQQTWDSGYSWVRLNQTLNPAETTLQLDRAVDWRPGDRVAVTTTDYLPGHNEMLEICAVGADQKSITVQTPGSDAACGTDTNAVKHLHNGEFYELTESAHEGIDRLDLEIQIRGGDQNGTKAAETRAAVALLTRDIRVVSGGDVFPEDEAKQTCVYDCFPEAATQYNFGGHMMARQGFAEFTVQGVEFFQLGQGGLMGRYPIHFHLARVTPAGTYAKDNSIVDSMTRWVTLHATQGVTVARNVGYLSIGHGFYLEDGTEINNRLYSNIGIFARAGVETQNPRQVPGILAQPGGTANPPFNSDVANPTVFWMMNGWNDFEYNMAAGANACGACYWLLPALNSGPSQSMTWESYASIQEFLPGGAPLKKFVGNYCTTAQLSINTVGATDACNGLAQLGPINNPNLVPEQMMPKVGGLRNPALCDGTCSNNNGQPCQSDADCGAGNTCTQDCSRAPTCGVPTTGPTFDNRDFCPVTTIENLTSSFHWPQQNFAAMWLRGRWFLLNNSVLSDSQNGGVGLVTGGDYTLSNVAPGQWQIARKSVLIGHTQAGACSNDPGRSCVSDPDCGMGNSCNINPFASNAGPFNPLKGTFNGITLEGLKCDNPGDGQSCVSKSEGMIVPLSNFAMQQRMYNIYDGPNYQDSNAYLDINTTSLSPQCNPGDGSNLNNNSANCPQATDWMYTANLGLPIDQETGECVLPNAAIGWKQPNGFYYPQAFHSQNLYFNNVDIRHLVIEPLWKPGTFDPDMELVAKNYCTFNPGIFTGFTSIDRQTVLNDDDGSLTGLLSPLDSPEKGETISVNLDTFFDAPTEAPECRSFDLANVDMSTTGGTAKTSPYQYVTTVVYPECAVNGDCGGRCSLQSTTVCDLPGKTCTPNECQGTTCSLSGQACTTTADCTTNSCEGSVWGGACSNDNCYGVPLTRQLTTTLGEPAAERTIPMMGMGFPQRSMMTVNGGTYYINTAVSEADQRAGRDGPVPITNINVFQKGQTYYVFFIYAKESTKQEYQIYIGENIGKFVPSNYVNPVRVNISGQDLEFVSAPWNGLDVKPEDYDAASGVLTIRVDFAEFAEDFRKSREDNCQPESFCALDDPNAPAPNCVCSSELMASDPELYQECVDGNICGTWGGKDVDCPLFLFSPGPGIPREIPGCLGFSIKMDSRQFNANSADHLPNSMCFPEMQPWNVNFTRAAPDIAGPACENTPNPDPEFCTL